MDLPGLLPVLQPDPSGGAAVMPFSVSLAVLLIAFALIVGFTDWEGDQ